MSNQWAYKTVDDWRKQLKQYSDRQNRLLSEKELEIIDSILYKILLIEMRGELISGHYLYDSNGIINCLFDELYQVEINPDAVVDKAIMSNKKDMKLERENIKKSQEGTIVMKCPKGKSYLVFEENVNYYLSQGYKNVK